jgi:hypothetical protein
MRLRDRVHRSLDSGDDVTGYELQSGRDPR